VLTKNKFQKIEFNTFQRVFFAFNVLVFHNLFYFVGLRHIFINKHLVVMVASGPQPGGFEPLQNFSPHWKTCWT